MTRISMTVAASAALLLAGAGLAGASAGSADGQQIVGEAHDGLRLLRRSANGPAGDEGAKRSFELSSSSLFMRRSDDDRPGDDRGRGDDDGAGHDRGRGDDGASGHDRGGSDDGAGHDRGGSHDDGSGHDRGGSGRGGHDDGPDHS